MASSPYIPTFKVIILGSDASQRCRAIESAIKHLQGVHLHSARECDVFSVVISLDKGCVTVGCAGNSAKKEACNESRRVYVLLNIYVMTTSEQLVPNPAYMGTHAAILYTPENMMKLEEKDRTEKELGHIMLCVGAFSKVCPDTPLYLVGHAEDVLGESSNWVDIIRDRLRGHILGLQKDIVADPEDSCLPLVAVCKTLLGDHRLWFDYKRPLGDLTPEHTYRIRAAYENSEGSVKTRYSLNLA